MKVTVYDLVSKRNKTMDKKFADILVKAGRAKYETKPMNNYNNRMLTADDEKENLKSKLTAAGIEFDGRMGVEKLKKLAEKIKG